VSAVETPPPAPPPEETAPRRCPRCGAELTPQQEWCLACGSDVGTRIAAAPSWRGPVALVAGLLAIAVIALVLALVELAGDAETVGPQAATPTPTPSAVAPTATATPESTTIPPATSEGTPGTPPEIADWPAGKDAWTVVLESASTRDAAQARANELAAQGVPVGLLNSDDYSSLEPHKWVVFSGQYDSRRAATQGLTDLSGQVTGGYVRHVVPGTPTGGATATPSPSASPVP
jgi:septal ring-binding cell division protein DamX